MLSAWEYLEQLCRHPHRGSATTAEAAVANEMMEWLGALGYQCEIQPFRTPRDTLYHGPMAVMLGLMAGAVVGWRWQPWAGVVICLLFLAPLIGELLGSSRLDFDWLLPRHLSQNLLARKHGAAAARPVRTLIISAHYDTQRASLLFHPRFVPWIKPYFMLVYANLFLVPLTLLLRWFSGNADWAGVLLAALCGLMAVHILFLLVCRLTGDYINGANDNGTGVALVLALADRFARMDLPDTQLLFLLTGAEEVGTRGMKAFMRTAHFDKATTRFINLDNLGGGALHYLTGEGMLAYKPYGPQLLSAAADMKRVFPEQVHDKRNLLLPTDGLIPALYGYESISFLAFLADGQLPNYHWHTDTLERVDRRLLAFTEQALVHYIQRLAGVGGTSRE